MRCIQVRLSHESSSVNSGCFSREYKSWGLISDSPNQIRMDIKMKDWMHVPHLETVRYFRPNCWWNKITYSAAFREVFYWMNFLEIQRSTAIQRRLTSMWQWKFPYLCVTLTASIQLPTFHSSMFPFELNKSGKEALTKVCFSFWNISFHSSTKQLMIVCGWLRYS